MLYLSPYTPYYTDVQWCITSLIRFDPVRGWLCYIFIYFFMLGITMYHILFSTTFSYM